MTRYTQESQIPHREGRLRDVDPDHFVAHGMTFVDGVPEPYDVVPPRSRLLEEGQPIARIAGKLVVTSELPREQEAKIIAEAVRDFRSRQ